MKQIKFIILVAMLLSIGVGGWYWWQHQTLYPSTDDAYVQANILTVAPLVGGKINTVSVVENAYVNAGDPLFTISADNYQAALETAQAQLVVAQQSSSAGGANVAAAEASLVRASSALKDTEQNLARIQNLFSKGDVARATLDTARTAHDEAAAERESAKAALAATTASRGQSGSSNAGVRAAQANVNVAQLNVDYTTVVAPTSGWVANIDLLPGTVVAANESLFSIVEDTKWWIDANFKETDLQRIRPGQPVNIDIDMYSNVELEGKVESIGAGSGSVFSLLPSENASGNWVKVTQRFPVRIMLDTLPQDEHTPLRVGASTAVTIDTTGLATP